MKRIKPKGTFLGIDVNNIPDAPKPAPGKNVRVMPAQPPEAEAKKKARDERQTLFRYHQFISHYLKNGGNATKAAILAGYAPAAAAQQGSDLLKHHYIREKIEAARLRMQANTEITIEKVMGELMKLGMSNMSDYVRVNEYGEPQIDLSDLDPDQWAAISEVETIVEMRGPIDDQYPVKKVKIKLYDKGSALEKIGKYLGAFDRRRGGQADGVGDDVPESVTHYTLQIGNANIVVNASTPGQGSGSSGSEAQVLTLPRA